MQFLKFLLALTAVVCLESFSLFHVPVSTGTGISGSTYDVSTADIRSAYEALQLSSKGLSYDAFGVAMSGMKHLAQKGLVAKSNIITIADLSQSSCKKRLYVIDLEHNLVLFQTYVAHGRNSGEEYARYFSNKSCTNKSSIGFYTTLDYQNTNFGQFPELLAKAIDVNSSCSIARGLFAFDVNMFACGRSSVFGCRSTMVLLP